MLSVQIITLPRDKRKREFPGQILNNERSDQVSDIA